MDGDNAGGYSPGFAVSDRARRGRRELCARCPVCGKLIVLRRHLFFGRRRAMELLQTDYLNRCPACGRFVCDDCFIIYGNDGNPVGLCGDCARARGIDGKTTTEMEDDN